MNIAIIGSGMTGLTAALKLSQQGHKVTIYEKEPYLGGLASSLKVGCENIDRFYHHIFVSDDEIISLIDELELSASLKWYEPKNAIYLDNSIHPFTSPLDLLRFKPISFISRIRMGLLVLSSKFIKDYKAFESVTAQEWIKKRSGIEAYEKVWKPLLKSKFDIDSDRISGTWIWNKFKLRGSSRSRNIGKEMLGYLDGGFISLADKIAETIVRSGGEILSNAEVKSVIKTYEDCFEIESNSNKAKYEKVLFTIAPEELDNIFQSSLYDYASKLRSIKYKANVCLMLELTDSLSPYYWITVSQEDLPFVLIIEHTNLVGLRGYGSHIVYLSRYLDYTDPLYFAPDRDITNKFIRGLKNVFPNFNEDKIKRSILSRAPYAQPVISLNYGNTIPCIKTPVDGLYLASMPQIYPEDRGLNYAVRLGYEAANEIMNDL